ncbi:MAG TPA: tetratricopeptide repeat protein [Terriglobia bacterium]|nr:tetratricopeptide repeat protein [Terriglobia bacterium]
MKIPSTILIACFGVMVLSGPASAADKDILQLQNDVVKLQQTVQALQKSVDDKNTAVLSRLDKTSDQVNNLTSSIQKIADLVATMRADNATSNAAAAASAAKSATETKDTLVPLINALQKSVGDLAEGMNGVRTQMTTISGQIASSKSTTEALPTCKDFKQAGDRDFNSGYYDNAIAGYRDFISMCGSDLKAAEVHFQMAESYFIVRKFDQALTEYDIVWQKYPGNDKIASALYKEGLTYVELKRLTDARAILTRLQTEYKGTPEAALVPAKLKELGPAPATGRGARGTQ